MEKKKVAKKKYWIFRTVFYCPLCCREEIYLERKYTLKPKDYNERQKFIEVYDYCNV